MSPQRPIDDDVRRFVLASVPSVAYLEAALFFRRQRARRTVDEAARALYIAPRQASEILDALCLAGVLAADGEHFHYAPRDEQVSEMLDRLAHAYATDLVAITHLIHDKTHRNARRFADAFKVRKDS
jgi:hypothetical protein